MPTTPTQQEMPGQCEGTTRAGSRCRIARSHDLRTAKPLRAGSAFCAHHQPDKFTGMQCEGVTKRGRCRVFSASLCAEAAPLRDGKRCCSWHAVHATPLVRCAGRVKDGHACRVTNRTQNPGAEPLRIGERYCAAHASQAERLATACEVSSSFVPPSCASCGTLHGELSQDTDSLHVGRGGTVVVLLCLLAGVGAGLAPSFQLAKVSE